MPEDLKNTIKKNQKEKARHLRDGMGARINEDGERETHKMESYGKYVIPSIYPESKDNYKSQNFDEAYKRGEVFEFRNERRAERFAFGSWKKGQEKREAMRDYRQYRKDLRNQKKSED